MTAENEDELVTNEEKGVKDIKRPFFNGEVKPTPMTRELNEKNK